MRPTLMFLVTLFVLVLLTLNYSQATVLTFDAVTGGPAWSQDMGDRVVAAAQDGFMYGTDHGFTPNIEIEWQTGEGSVGSGVIPWNSNFGDLINVIEAEPEPNGTQFSIIADPGYVVELHSFDMAGWNQADYTINAVRVRDGDDNILFEIVDAMIAGSGPNHTDFDFPQPLTASVIKIEWDSNNLGQSSDNIGMDNVAFGQSEAVPEPSTCLLLISTSILWLRARKI